MQIKEDAWLVDIFHHNVFRVMVGDASPTLNILSQHMREQRRAFYFAKVPSMQVRTVSALADLGFRVVDVSMMFERKIGNLAALPVIEPVGVQEAQPEHFDALQDIAMSCFVYSRFHLDPDVSNNIANDIKRAWVYNHAIKARGDMLFAALVDGQPAGFLAALMATYQGMPCAILDLIGVDRAYQGRGVGKALTVAFIKHYASRVSLLRVGTQVANIPSMRLYETCGFRMAETTYVLHAHVSRSGSESAN